MRARSRLIRRESELGVRGFEILVTSCPISYIVESSRTLIAHGRRQLRKPINLLCRELLVVVIDHACLP